MSSNRRTAGFTLIEIMMVVIILSILAAVAVPKYASSTETARRNADIATGRQVKSALDRYMVDNGLYPKPTELKVNENGLLTFDRLIPKYISKLDKTVTQQRSTDKSGFGVATIGSDGTFPAATNIIMIYLSNDGSLAEVKVHDVSQTELVELWSSN